MPYYFPSIGDGLINCIDEVPTGLMFAVASVCIIKLCLITKIIVFINQYIDTRTFISYRKQNLFSLLSLEYSYDPSGAQRKCVRNLVLIGQKL